MMTATSADATAVPGPRSDATRFRRQSLYKGDPGMWAFALHRITGATIFFFLFVHVLDTALVRVSPEAYTEVIATYKTPLVGLMELGLVAAVLFHGLNGVRLILIDFWWQGTRYHRQMLVAVGVIWLVVMVPVVVRIGMHMVERFL
ncbi:MULTISPECIES: succinate dehydrogenase, cytochrome b556 subunit [Mycolicibacter]|uniref:succinate dehydrogenase, cytochrome b556 subunit n=1 Tax=Mycolicibacter TaxID=1073531 RepID=UPI0013F4DB16|nr:MULTISPECIES: succinate dehydrogenase, cytochrome b556 subunit [Mycobacteriaceae]ULP49985.1 succinate dehydrogenase, cytochrome b556 subunit [Mycolicibacter virginiensis]